jgi:hypothetical protein
MNERYRPPEYEDYLPVIGIDEFQNPPTRLIRKYKLGQPITRDNICAVLIDSFVKSQGYPGVQESYFEWIKLNGLLDYQQTLQNLLDAGDVYSLTRPEKGMLISSYKKVGFHRQDLGWWKRDQKILNKVSEQLSYHIDFRYREESASVSRVYDEEILGSLSPKAALRGFAEFVKENPVY